MLDYGEDKEILMAMKDKKIISVEPHEGRVFFGLDDGSRVEIYLHCHMEDCFLGASCKKE